MPPSCLACEQRAVAIYQSASPSILHLTPTPTTYGTAFVYTHTLAITTAHLLPLPLVPISATLPDATALTLHPVHTDRALDIALLAVHPPTPLPPPLPPRLTALPPGHTAYALTARAAAAPALSAGVVSALCVSAAPLHAEPPHLTDLVQLDLPVNCGASGAPLLDSAGAVAGMLCAIASHHGRFEGVSYAIPADHLRRVAARASYPRL